MPGVDHEINASGRHRRSDPHSQHHHRTRPTRMLLSSPLRHEHARDPSRYSESDSVESENAHFHSDHALEDGNTGLELHSSTDMVTALGGISKKVISLLSGGSQGEQRSDHAEHNSQTEQAAAGPPEQTNSKTNKRRAKVSSPDADELRLLGQTYTGKTQSHAIPISGPTYQSQVHTAPRSTMRRSKPGSSVSMKPRDSLGRSAHGPSKSLEVQRNSGYNVGPTTKGSTRFPDEQHDRMLVTPGKRRKIGHSIQDHGQEVMTVENETPLALKKSLEWPGDSSKRAIDHTSEQGRQQSHPKTPRTSSPKKTGGQRGILEYRHVEAMMNPSRKASFTTSQHFQSPVVVDERNSIGDPGRKRSTSSESPARTYASIVGEPMRTAGRSSIMDPSISSLEDPSIRHDHSVSHDQDARSSKLPAINGVKSDQRLTENDNKRRHTRGPELEADQHRPTQIPLTRKKLKMKRQSEEVDGSPDELGVDNRVQSKYFGHESRVGPEDVHSSTFIANPVPAGSIRRTDFSTTSRGKVQESRPASYVDRNGNKKNEVYKLMPLTYYLWSGSSSRVPQKALGITYDQDSNCFAIDKHTKDRSPKYPWDTIPMGRIVKVIMASDANEVRLMGSSDTDMGQLWYHVAFESSEDMDQFIRILGNPRNSSIRQIWKKTHVLQKIFHAKENEVDPRTSHGQAVLDEEFSMMEGRIGTSTTENVESYTTRRSSIVRQKLKSQMQTEDHQQSHVKEGSQPPSRRRHNSVEENVPASLRATRSSNRITTKSSPVQKAKSPSPVKYSIVHGLGPKWKKPVQFPSTGRAKATVDFSDLLRLDEGEFLNDNLIGFYMNYAFDKAEKNNHVLPNSVYMFNTFFYSALTGKRASKGIDYAAVARWTRQVDLFTYDYIVIPINEDFHWYLAIICNLPATHRTLHAERTQTPEIIASLQDQTAQLHLKDHPSVVVDDINEDNSSEWPDPDENPQASTDSPFRKSASAAKQPDTTIESAGALLQSLPRSNGIAKKGKRKKAAGAQKKYDPSQPVIVILDSMGSGHFKTTANLKAYVSQEGKAKRNIDVNIKEAMTAKGLPEQQNFHDCGVYILAYFEKFLDNPRGFIRKLLQREMDPSEDWPDMDPSKLRHALRRLLQGLYKKQAQMRENEKANKHAVERTDKSGDGNEASAAPGRERSPFSGQLSDQANYSETAPPTSGPSHTLLDEPSGLEGDTVSQISQEPTEYGPTEGSDHDSSEIISRENGAVVGSEPQSQSGSIGSEDRSNSRESPAVVIDPFSKASGLKPFQEYQEEPDEQPTLFEEQQNRSSPLPKSGVGLTESDSSLPAMIPDPQASTSPEQPQPETLHDLASVEIGDQLHTAASRTPVRSERGLHQPSSAHQSSGQGRKQHVLQRVDSDPTPLDSSKIQTPKLENSATNHQSPSAIASTHEAFSSPYSEPRSKNSSRRKNQKKYGGRKSATAAPSHPQEIIDLSSDHDKN